ncbi:MAG TPA: Uma2 family endonuclease [Bryobacteraceae bacterium]|jgi:Uma2 family endonuclease|nr:Uma2 family endonuclease [Bryobacteraceae bacterium]
MNAVTHLTDEQFLALPDEPGKQELLEGELISLPPAKLQHNKIVRRFFELLSTVLDPARVWIETGYHIASGWLQPDVSVIRPDQPEGEWFEGSPMIAIEIASRGNTDEEIDRKVEAYLSGGCLEIWVVRPRTASMTVHRKESILRVTGHYECESVGTAVDVASLIHG